MTAGSYGIVAVYADPSESRINTSMLPRVGPIDSEAVLVLGPVLGPFQLIHNEDGLPRATATILVEVDGVCNVKCCCEDVLSGEVYVGNLTATAGRARVVRVPGLRLGRRYSLRVMMNDTSERTSTCFHTPDSFGADVNMCILSGHRPTRLLPGDPDILANLAERLTAPWHGLDVVVHIGFRASFVAALQESSLILYRDNNPSSVNGGFPRAGKMRRALEHHVLERFRDEYRGAYSTPAMHAILAASTNILTGCARTLLAGASALPACDQRRLEVTKALPHDATIEEADGEWRLAVLQTINLALRVSFEFFPSVFGQK